MNLKVGILVIIVCLGVALGATEGENPAPEPPSKVVTLNEENFDRELARNPKEKWFVMFFAKWCGHCKHLKPEWAKLAEELEGSNYRIAAVDCEENPDLSDRFQIMGFPTLLFFQNGNYTRYKQRRDIESMKQFIFSDGASEEQNQIPKAGPPASLLSFTTFQRLMMRHPFIFSLTIVLVVFGGFLLIMNVCCSGDDLPPPPKAAAAPPTGAEATAAKPPSTEMKAQPTASKSPGRQSKAKKED